jgi:hypothetical protein
MEDHRKYGNSCIRSKVRFYKTKNIGTTILLDSFINLIIVIENYLTYKYVNLVYLNSVNIFYLFYQHLLILKPTIKTKNRALKKTQ